MALARLCASAAPLSRRALLVVLLVALRGAAAITMPTHIASSMVVQRGVPFPLWGTDVPGATVTASVRGASFTALTGGDGVFNVSLPAAPASTVPTTISLSSSAGGRLALEDVLWGALPRAYMCRCAGVSVWCGVACGDVTAQL